MKIKSKQLIDDLRQLTLRNIAEAEKFLSAEYELLNWKSDETSWSVLECLEHLNRYGDFYLPELRRRMDESKHKTASVWFKSGLLGNYFAKMMLPKEKLNKMKTFKPMNPIGSKLDISVLNKFIEQQETLLDLLEKAGQIDLSKTKTSISISNLIKLRIGDTFRFVIYHNQRHLVQCQKAQIAYFKMHSKKGEMA